MKKLLSLLSLFLLLKTTLVNAQPAAEKDPEGYVSGQVLLPNNSIVTGNVKDNIRKKGEVTIMSDGKKLKYKAGDIMGVRIGSSNYVISNYTFYEIIFEGSSITLLRKANEPSGIQYNGTEPVAIAGSEGNVDDYFIKKTNETALQLLSKKNIKEILEKFCSTCSSAIDATKFDIENIKKAIIECDKCK